MIELLADFIQSNTARGISTGFILLCLLFRFMNDDKEKQMLEKEVWLNEHLVSMLNEKALTASLISIENSKDILWQCSISQANDGYTIEAIQGDKRALVVSGLEWTEVEHSLKQNTPFSLVDFK